MDMTDEQAWIGCWLGIVHGVGSNMTYWVLIEAGHAIARSTVQHITVTDMATNAIKMRVHTFDTSLLTRLDDANFTNDLPNHVFFLQDNDLTDPTAADPIPLDVEYGDMLQPDRPEADEVAFETFDQYIGAEFLTCEPKWRFNAGKGYTEREHGTMMANQLVREMQIRCWTLVKYECALDDESINTMQT